VSIRVRSIHLAWIVAALTMLALVAGAAFRSTTGALFEPMETEFGWTRSGTSGAVTLNLIVYGLTAPFAAAAMERLGVKRVVLAGLVLTALGSGLTVFMTALWQLWILWGLFVGVGTGVMALVFGSIVANRWFVRHRGLVMGIFSGGNACGQLVFLPLIVALAEHEGWRAAALATALVAAAIIPFVARYFADSPHAVGLRPYGEEPDNPVPAPAKPQVSPARLALQVLRESLARRPFWILLFTFWVCGWSTNGLIQTHFIPAAHDHGMPATTAAGLLALIGVFDLIGTVASGWLTDRFNPAILLVCYYALRGLSLVFVNSLLGPSIEPPLWVFIVFYGLDWVATVPPTAALCREHFGIERAGVVFGWVFASHMVGAGVAAATAGWLRETTGSYHPAWVSAAVLCWLAAASLFWLRKAPVPQESRPSPDVVR
jgi:sugar phosphate permease